jgi:hypothetical protein
VKYSWDWNDDVDTAAVERNKRGNGRKQVKVPHNGLVTPTDQLPAVRGSVQVDPFPPVSVYEDIAIEVLIAQGYTTDEAILEVETRGWGAAGLTLSELEAVDDDIDWDEEGEIIWENDELIPPKANVSGLTLVGDVAIAAFNRLRKERSGLDEMNAQTAEYLSSIDR